MLAEFRDAAIDVSFHRAERGQHITATADILHFYEEVSQLMEWAGCTGKAMVGDGGGQFAERKAGFLEFF